MRCTAAHFERSAARDDEGNGGYAEVKRNGLRQTPREDAGPARDARERPRPTAAAPPHKKAAPSPKGKTRLLSDFAKRKCAYASSAKYLMVRTIWLV